MRTGPGAVALLGLLGMLLVSLAMAVPVAAQGRAPGGNFSDPVVREVDIAEPAIVRIGTLYQGSITFDVCGQAYTLPSSTTTLTIAALGSGAFISSSGDILTADHVVDIDKSDLDSAIIQLLASNIADVLNANASCLNLGGAVTPDQISYQSLVDSGIPFTTSYSAPQYMVWLDVDYTGPDTNGATNSTDPLTALMLAQHMTATLSAESQFTNNDLAVLHVSMADTPSIALDNSDNVAVEDQLTAIGFPGNGDASHPDDTYDTTDLVTPTVDSLDVVAVKSNDNGASLLQVSGPIEHGDSGGPALDAGGNIVGIVSYSATDTPIGSFFLRSSNSARDLISSAGINTHPGSFETLWRQAFDDYASTANGHWHTAAHELDALNAQYPAFRGVLPFRMYADQAELSEFTLDDNNQSLVAAIALAIALVALVMLLIILLVTSGRRQRRRRLAQFPPASSLPSDFGPGYGGYGPSSRYSGYPPGYQPAGIALPQGYAGGVPPGMYMPGSPGGSDVPVVNNGIPSRPIGDAAAWPAAALPVAGQFEDPAGRAYPATWRNVCSNGHAMTPVEALCSVCGMPRPSASASIPQSHAFNQ